MKCTACHNAMAHHNKDLHGCPVCGLISSDLPADPVIYNEEYWAKYRVLGRSNLGCEITAARARKVAEYTYRKILDFGCGAGTFINRLLADGIDVTGFDINPHSGQCVVERLYDSYSGVTFWDSLEHLNDPAMVLKGISADYVFICTPNSNNHDGRNLTTWKHYRPKEHIHYFNESSLKVLLASCGFDMVEVSFEESLWRLDGEQNIITVVGKRQDLID